MTGKPNDVCDASAGPVLNQLTSRVEASSSVTNVIAPLVLMSPAEAIALLRMAERSGPQDAIEAEVIAHLVKLAGRIVDIERRSE